MFTETTTVDRHSFFNILYCALSVSITETLRTESAENHDEEEYMHPELVADSHMLQES